MRQELDGRGPGTCRSMHFALGGKAPTGLVWSCDIQGLPTLNTASDSVSPLLNRNRQKVMNWLIQFNYKLRTLMKVLSRAEIEGMKSGENRDGSLEFMQLTKQRLMGLQAGRGRGMRKGHIQHVFT